MRAHLSRFWLLYVVVLAGALLRLEGIGFSHGIPKARPDEELFIQQALMLFSGDLNPHWAGNGWPELYFFFVHIALRVKLLWLESTYGAVNLGCLYALDPQQLHVPARMVSWLFGVLTIPLTYLFARDALRRADGLGHIAGLGAAAMIAFNVLHTRDSHFAVSDTALVFFMTLGLWQLVRAVNTTAIRPLFYAAFAFGVGSSIKYTGLVMLGMLGLAALERFFRAGSERQRRRMLAVGFAVLGTFVLGFVLGSPHVLEEPTAFLDGLLSHNVRYAEGGWSWGYDPAHVAQRGISFHGTASLPVAMGWPLTLLALAGTLLALWRARGGAFYVAFFVAFFYVAVLGPSSILFMRYAQPLFPPLSVLAMLVPLELLRARAIRGDDRRVVWATPVALALLLALPAITIVQTVTRMGRQDTRDQAIAWLVSNLEDGDMVRSESGFLAIPTLDQALVDACMPAVPEGLRRPVVSWGRSGARFPAMVAEGPAGWGHIAMQHLVRSADLGPTTSARYVVQSFPQLTCGRDVDYHRITDLPPCFEELARFSPGVSDCETRYDTADMFMLPVEAPAGVERPGPTVVIHRNRCRDQR